MGKSKTWKLIYPDKTESLTNFDPIENEKEKMFIFIEKLKKWIGVGILSKKSIIKKIDKFVNEMESEQG